MQDHSLAEKVNPIRSTSLGTKTSRNATALNSLNERALVYLPISRVQPYENNPRRRNNPNYGKIKESIFKDGLNQPLVVTRRPDKDDFIVYKGGNTRLKAIKELFAETGDHRFRFVECSFIPWSGNESDAVIGHLQENEMRKSLCFIDKSAGIKSAIDLLQIESEENEELSIRECHTRLIAKGYSLTLSSLSIMLYASDMVEPYLSSDACETMGRRPIQNLRKIQKAFTSVCKEFDKSENEANQLFKQSLIDFPESEWNYKTFRRSLEANLTAEVTASIQDVSLRLDGYLNLSPVPLEESFDRIYPELVKLEQHQLLHPGPVEVKPEVDTASDNISTETNVPIHDDKRSTGITEESQDVPSTRENQSNRPRPDKPSPATAALSSQQTALDLRFKELKTTAFKAASRIAKNYRFLNSPETKRRIVLNTGDWGMGYLVADYPPPVERVAPSVIATRDALWWLLLEFSDLQWAVECARPFTAKLIGNTGLIHFIKSGDIKSLSFHAKGKMKCNVPHLRLFSFCLRQLDNDTRNSLLDLIDTYHSIHQLATENNVHIFQPPNRRGKSNVPKQRS